MTYNYGGPSHIAMWLIIMLCFHVMLWMLMPCHNIHAMLLYSHSFIHSFLYCNKCQNAFAVTLLKHITIMLLGSVMSVSAVASSSPCCEAVSCHPSWLHPNYQVHTHRHHAAVGCHRQRPTHSQTTRSWYGSPASAYNYTATHCLLSVPVVWLYGLVVSTLGIRTPGPGFDSRVVLLFHWVPWASCILILPPQFLSSKKLRYKKGVFGA